MNNAYDKSDNIVSSVNFSNLVFSDTVYDGELFNCNFVILIFYFLSRLEFVSAKILWIAA